MERVSDEWISRTLAIAEENCGKHGTVEVLGRVLVLVLNELQEHREAENEHGHTEHSASEKEGAVLPIPCTKGFEDWTVKQWFAKINEELDEMKEEIYMGQVRSFRKARIAEEACDTITAITSMLEAMGIDEQARQAAQRRVNEHNLKRGRFD